MGFKFANADYFRLPKNAEVVGYYQHSPVENAWHIGEITQVGDALCWNNKAGASWTLTPDFENQRLLTGTDNPYYGINSSNEEFKLILDRDLITGFEFAGATYSRISPP